MKSRPIGQDIHVTSTAIESYIDQKMMDTGDWPLTGIEGMTLAFLAEKGEGITMKEVMDHFHIVKSTASQTLSGLVKKGMIELKEDKTDKRKKIINLTKEGRTKQHDLDHRMDQMNQIIEKDFSEEERKTLHTLLEKIRMNLGLEY